MTLDEMIEAPPKVLDALPPVVLMGLQMAADAHMSEASKMQAILHDVLVRRYARGLNKLGTTHIVDGDIDVSVTIPKRIKWNQDVLAEIAKGLADAGEDAGEYIDTKLDVQERKYTAWPASLSVRFEPARTVETGKPKIVLSLAKLNEEAA